MEFICFPMSNAEMRGFDDFQLRQQSCLQQQLGQILPLTADGGRVALWWCPSCRRVWYEQGRCIPVQYVNSVQARTLANALCLLPGATSPRFPQACCPTCMAATLGGIPRTFELQNRRGYQLTWERTASPALFLCLAYAVQSREDGDLLQKVLPEALSIPVDLPIAPLTQLRQMLHWLRDMPDPVDILPLSVEDHETLMKQHPVSDAVWHGYAWICRNSPIGPALLLFAVALPEDIACSVEILLSCWRLIALEMAYML